MRCLGFLVAALLAWQPAHAADLQQRHPFAAPVAVGADGRVEVGEVEWVQGKLAEVVRAELGKLPYVPGQVGGIAVDSKVLVDGVVVLDPVGDEFAIAIEDLETQPLLLQWRPADYTIPMMRARRDGLVSLVLQVGADGRVRSSEVVAGDGDSFDEAAREAVGDWRFAPSGTGYEVGAAFWFHGNWTADPRVPEVACTVPAQLAHLPGEDGCLRISETTGTIVKRGDRPAPNPHLVPSPALPGAGGHRAHGG